jgi:hypothetical protein
MFEWGCDAMGSPLLLAHAGAPTLDSLSELTEMRTVGLPSLQLIAMVEQYWTVRSSRRGQPLE